MSTLTNPTSRPFINDGKYMHRPKTCPSPLQEARIRVERRKAELVELEMAGAQHRQGCRTLTNAGPRAIQARQIRCELCDAEEGLNNAVRHERDVLHDPVRLWPGEAGAR